ncbi:hypothetical protein EXN66_Car002687 [Channa argus]|uniref:Uncharacterized protein n=1 Tax=Channa argus TaxID=215402 RepID=A0A6G1P9S8_CHAAH|nr:hypothetical protein EXN66_Car002687 [Channa argus]
MQNTRKLQMVPSYFLVSVGQNVALNKKFGNSLIAMYSQPHFPNTMFVQHTLKFWCTKFTACHLLLTHTTRNISLHVISEVIHFADTFGNHQQVSGKTGYLTTSPKDAFTLPDISLFIVANHHNLISSDHKSLPKSSFFFPCGQFPSSCKVSISKLRALSGRAAFQSMRM